MRKLYERYWQIASELDKEDADKQIAYRKVRWNQRLMKKGEEEFVLMDKVVQIIDQVAKDAEKEFKSIKVDKDKYI